MKTKLVRTLSLCVAVAVTFVAAVSTAGEGRTIVETAVEAGSFKTLAAALKAADLVDTLQGEGPFTVFAPTDEAFAKLPKGTVESLLKPENKDELVSILTYHVVAGRVLSETVVESDSLKSLQGAVINVKAKANGVKIEGAKLLKADINASNGVIHVIDTVIMPPKKVSAAAAKQSISHAVVQGSKLFNAGHHDRCASVYMGTMQELLESGAPMPTSLSQRMELIVSQAQHQKCPTQRSWMLRHGLDQAYYALAAH